VSNLATGVQTSDTAPMDQGHQQGADIKPSKKAWESVSLFHDGDSFFDALEVAIKSARRSVHLESYIFATDRLGERILGAIDEAANRGVDVRVIIDGVGSSAWSSQIRARAKRGRFQLKVFHEIPWGRLLRRRKRVGKAGLLWGVFRHLNNRNHRKVCLIDGVIAFVGSLNVVEYHCRRYVGDGAWRDTGVCVKGGEVSVLAASFLEVWRGRTLRVRSRTNRIQSGALVRLNARRRLRSENYLDLLVKILGSQRRVWITNAYFVPDASLIRVLGVAAEAGVDVRIVVPAFSDVVFIPWVTSAFHLGLLRAGVRIFEYTGTVLHAKTMLIDDWGLVGSSNLNHRSLLHDLEADVVLGSEEATGALAEQFIADCAHAREVTLRNWKSRPLLERIVGRMLLLVRRVL
jgi:cardiolipin synthase